ncbi:MAG: cytochrome-c oxidase, cbb3-type subunit III [Proteobacteria bacterium]|nr:cytochrome-c oxidase, cbb3-type subunit III [Pseudomonadota bacterium]
MSDFTSSFWSWYVSILTIVSVLACAFLLYRMGRMRVAKAPQAADGKTATTGHVWDEDLAEYNNPLPRWWMWLFYITIVFACIYLALYPGLGKFPGLLGWTSAGAYQDDVRATQATVAPMYAKYLTMDIPAVAADPAAHATGERLFLTYCAQCHGSDAGGSKGFPNLRDSDWLYGGDPATIKASITNGRNGIMPAFGPALGDEKIRQVVNYVRTLSGLPADSLLAQLGRPVFMENCAACHGADGKGNQAVGAPNLTDSIWLYGSTIPTLIETVTKGRGEAGTLTRMPAHKDLLDDGKIQLLAAYVWGLSHTAAAPPPPAPAKP